MIITILLMALTGYFAWLAGQRRERGKLERQQAEFEATYANERVRHSGGVRLSTMQIRR